MGDDISIVSAHVYFRVCLAAHLNTNRVSLGVFEEVMRQKAEHGWSWGLSYGSLMVTHDPSNAANSRCSSGRTATLLLFFSRNETAAFVQKSFVKSPFLSRAQCPRSRGPSSAISALCEWRVVTREPQMGGRWGVDGFHTVHGHSVDCLAPEKKITEAACVPVHVHVSCVCLRMEERQECSSWCHGNRLSGVV